MSILRGLQFYPGDTFLHRLDPRVKLLISLLLLASSLMFIEVTVITVIILVEAGLAYSAKALDRWIKTVYGAAPLIIIVFLLNYVFRSLIPGQILGISGLYESFAAAYRLIAFLASFHNQPFGNENFEMVIDRRTGNSNSFRQKSGSGRTLTGELGIYSLSDFRQT